MFSFTKTCLTLSPSAPARPFATFLQSPGSHTTHARTLDTSHRTFRYSSCTANTSFSVTEPMAFSHSRTSAAVRQPRQADPTAADTTFVGVARLPFKEKTRAP